MKESGTSMSLRTPLLMATAALWIWLAQSRFCCRSLHAVSERPASGTQGTGSHHFSSFRCIDFRNDDDMTDDVEVTEANDLVPASAYQNSASWKLSCISCASARVS
jgi:hypothetical protein